jgi:hypothetical protein
MSPIQRKVELYNKIKKNPTEIPWQELSARVFFTHGVTHLGPVPLGPDTALTAGTLGTLPLNKSIYSLLFLYTVFVEYNTS